MHHETRLAVLFGQVVDELRELHPEQAIVASIQPDLSLLCDPRRLDQLLSNLVKNAVVHGDATAPIEIAVISHNGRFSIVVSNCGPDLPQSLIDKLFKPFWRAPSSSGHQGLGLGLYIVLEIARSHSGAIDVVSRTGKVTFTFSMPTYHRAACIQA